MSRADHSHVKLRFPLALHEEGWPPVGGESVWARPTFDGFHQVLNVPFFVAGVHCHDVSRLRQGTG